MCRAKIIVACVLTVLGASIVQGQAAEVLLADPGNYFESFLAAGSRSVGSTSEHGRAVVGLHLGHGTGPFELGHLRALVPPMEAALGYCVRVTSFDGRYWSLNGYRQATPDAAPVGMETRSRFTAELSQRYRSDDVSVEIMATAECDPAAEGTLIPAVPPGATDYSSLVAYLNVPGSRAAARLADGHDHAIVSARCHPATDDQAIAFTEVCDFPLAVASWGQVARLQIVLVGEQGTPTQLSYDMRLPSRHP